MGVKGVSQVNTCQRASNDSDPLSTVIDSSGVICHTSSFCGKSCRDGETDPMGGVDNVSNRRFFGGLGAEERSAWTE